MHWIVCALGVVDCACVGCGCGSVSLRPHHQHQRPLMDRQPPKKVLSRWTRCSLVQHRASAERVTASFCTVVSAVKKKNLTPPRPASSEPDTWQDIVDCTTKCRFRAKGPGVSQLVQREAEYVELIVSLVKVQIKLEESSAADFAKVDPPAIVNTYGAGKTVLGETVVDVMVSNADVYDKCAERLGVPGVEILDSLRAHPPVRVQVCFPKQQRKGLETALLKAISMLNRGAPVDGVDESSSPMKLIGKLADLGSDHGRHSVYIHFDEVGELPGVEADVLRCDLLSVAQGWICSSKPRRMRRLLFLFTGKALSPASAGAGISSSAGFSYLHMSALTVDSIRLLQARYSRLNQSLANVSG